MNPIELSIFAGRIEAVCDEMGAVLKRTAFSPNIKERLDFSCAIFDNVGELCAQAAHIPVHLGSMAYAMAGLVGRMEWSQDDVVVVNDPYLGGTHLPDVTVISPVFVKQEIIGFVVNRAHHADIGAHSPGSMPVSKSLEEEGTVIPPSYLVRRGTLNEDLLNTVIAATSNAEITRGDFTAQMSANKTGVQRLIELTQRMGIQKYKEGLAAINDYGERLARSALAEIPNGSYRFQDAMDDDGLGNRNLAVQVAVHVRDQSIIVDFSGTAPQTEGNINCPLSVVAAAVYYVFRCLMSSQTPACAGAFRSISLRVPAGTLLNATWPAAVAAGNVETSSRIVDVVLGALAKAVPDRIPAASQGTMNNIAMGSRDVGGAWDYYETVGGGMGAGPQGGGLSAVQTHMTNTRNTPIEVLEMGFPVRINRYSIRDGSGGAGLVAGGNGVIREFEFLKPAQVTVLSERRCSVPWGLRGGKPGAAGRNLHNEKPLPGKISVNVKAGDRLTVLTPGGGGWGVE